MCPAGACAALLLIAAATVAISTLSTSIQAETTAQTGALTPDQKAIIEQIGKAERAENVGYAGAPADTTGDKISLPFRDGKLITLIRKRTTLQGDGSISWIGEVEETGERAVLMVWGNSLLTGYFAYKGTIFAIESLGGGVQAFAELGRNNQLQDHPTPPGPRDSVPEPGEAPILRSPPPEPPVPSFSDTERQALEAKKITIDLMILYTRNVAKHYVRSPQDLLALVVEEFNQTLRNSGLGNITLRLVHTQVIDYDTSGEDQFIQLYAMVDGLGPFKDVKKLRNEKRADIVGLIIDNPNGWLCSPLMLNRSDTLPEGSARG
jgi:hypothetical protein